MDLAAIFPKILAAWIFVNGQGFPHFLSQIVKFLDFLRIEGVGKKYVEQGLKPFFAKTWCTIRVPF